MTERKAFAFNLESILAGVAKAKFFCHFNIKDFFFFFFPKRNRTLLSGDGIPMVTTVYF